jgi:hypothetical protein
MPLVLMNQNFMWVCIGNYTSPPSSLHVSINVGHLTVEPLSFLDLPSVSTPIVSVFTHSFYFPHFTTKAWRFMLSGGVFGMVVVLLYNF